MSALTFIKFAWALWRACRRYPQMRIGQLIVNASQADLFYVRAQDLTNDLNRYSVVIPLRASSR